MQPPPGPEVAPPAGAPTLPATVDPALDRVVRLTAAALAVRSAVFSVIEPQRELVRSAVLVGRRAPIREIPIAHSLLAGAARAGGVLRVCDVGEHAEYDHNPVVDALGVVAFLAVPVVVEGRTVGVLGAIADVRRPWSPEDVALMGDLALVAADAIELAAQRLGAADRGPARPPLARAAPRELPPVPEASAPAERSPPGAPTGAPVGLCDRRTFHAVAQDRMTTARRVGRGLLLFLVRVDDMARVRERFGPGAADAALDEVADVVERTAGPGDLVGRLTSDAFVILTADGGHGEAARTLGRLQLGIAERNGEGSRTWTLSVRCGVAAWDPLRPVVLDQLLLRADGSARERARAQVSA